MKTTMYDIEINAGAFDTLFFEVFNDDDTPMDLTGYQFKIQFRDCPGCDLIHEQTGTITNTNQVSFEFSETITSKFQDETRYEIEMITPDNKHLSFMTGACRVAKRIYKDEN